jgi:hypothetical protein
VISTKQKSEAVLLDLSTAPDNDVNEGELAGAVHEVACQLNLKIQEVGVL